MKQDRRVFLKTLGAASVAGAAPARSAAALAPPSPPPSTDAERAAAEPVETYVYLSSAEVAFLEAALARLIPPDQLGPGAKVAGAFGTMAREYRQGPWAEGTPQQGYQSRLTPQEVYRAAIAETDRRCEAAYGKRFAALLPVQQEEVLRALDEGTLGLETVPAR